MGHVKKNMLSFFMTTKCNLDCLYCYTNKNTHTHQTISIDFAKLGISTFLGKNGITHIRFFGAGEPTEEFDLMVEICKYADDVVEFNVTKEIQTNCIISQDKLKWLARNIDIIWVSCDGDPLIQDYFRKSIDMHRVSELLEQNIRYLVLHGKGMVGIRSTITNINVFRQREMIKYFYNLGVKYVWSDPIFPIVGSLKPVDSLDLMAYAEAFVDAEKYASELGIVYRSFLGCNFDEEVLYHCRACLPAPHLTTDGFVSACDMALFGNDNNHMSPFIYGLWDKENNKIVIDDKKVHVLQSRSVDNMPECKNCEVKYNCGGYCLGEVLNETYDLFGRKKQVCEPIKYLSKHIQRNIGCYKYLHP